MRKKGEITSQQIVILIVLIASFAILLFFLFRLNLGGETDKELCRNSVLLKGKSVFKDSTLLNCKTSYVCLTADGNCDSSDLLKPELKKVKTKNEVYKVLAEEMRDCWWMFGEGKVNYIGDDLTRNVYCSICSQVVFDDSVKKVFNGKDSFDKNELYEFLEKNNLSGSETSYLGYLYGIKEIEGIKTTLESQGTNFGTIILDSNKGYLVMTGIMAKVSHTNWVAGGALLGLAGVGVVLGFLAAPFTAGTSVPVSIGLFYTAAGALAGGTAGSLFAIGVEGASGNEDFLVPTLISPDQFNRLKCEEVVTLS